ncbi:hypothetical protein [Actinopolymorpha alba]|uniref:hypothetical protein n=1 Tax=Actinopolymorpha alba TaxID=533267 RepID=UPI00039E6CF1|nr:hypothetical protein [Actinopolymorpha alba]
MARHRERPGLRSAVESAARALTPVVVTTALIGLTYTQRPDLVTNALTASTTPVIGVLALLVAATGAAVHVATGSRIAGILAPAAIPLAAAGILLAPAMQSPTWTDATSPYVVNPVAGPSPRPTSDARIASALPRPSPTPSPTHPAGFAPSHQPRPDRAVRPRIAIHPTSRRVPTSAPLTATPAPTTKAGVALSQPSQTPAPRGEVTTSSHPSGTLELSRAQLVGIGHQLSGTARLVTWPDGNQLVVLEQLTFTPTRGSVSVYLTAHGATAKPASTPLILLGGNATNGYVYAIPGGRRVTRPAAILLWRLDLDRALASASLTP